MSQLIHCVVMTPDVPELQRVAMAVGESVADYLGCRNIDVISFGGDIDAWVDDEWRSNSAAPNIIATNMLRAFGWHLQSDDVVLGPVLFASVDEMGRTVSLSERQHDIVADAYAQALRM